MTVKKSNLSKSRKKVFDGSFEGAELPCVIIFAWFRIHLAVACETFSINRLFSHGKSAIWAPNRGLRGGYPEPRDGALGASLDRG